MLVVSSLNYSYDEREIFNNISFTLHPGEILYIQGINGCGKTSLLKLLTGLIHPSNGQIQWNAVPIHTIREQFYADLHYIGHQLGLKGDLTVLEHLHLLNHLWQVPPWNYQALLNKVKLMEYQHQFIKYLSAGQQRRLAFVALLATFRKLWLLDEPYTALDTEGIFMMNECFKEHLNQGGMIIFTSHQKITLDEIPLQTLYLRPGVTH